MDIPANSRLNSTYIQNDSVTVKQFVDYYKSYKTDPELNAQLHDRFKGEEYGKWTNFINDKELDKYSDWKITNYVAYNKPEESGFVGYTFEPEKGKAVVAAADATVDLAKGLGAMAVATAGMNAGAAIGTFIPIPVVGTVVGAEVGFAVGYVGTLIYNNVVDNLKINGKSVSDYAKEGTKYILDKGVDVGKDVCIGAANMAKDVGSKVTNNLDNAARKVGNFFNGASKSLSGVFG